MPVSSLIKVSEYYDSVTLMVVAHELSAFPGVEDAAVVMGTEANKAILQQAGLLTPEAESASPNDLVISVKAAAEVLPSAIGRAELLLAKNRAPMEKTEYQVRTLRAAVKQDPQANLAVISVAGRYAAAEAWEALRLGLHVLLFSDNVSLEDEIALKSYATQNNLLLMGPGAGTAILNGVALGFANQVPRGPVGIVSAAGTGLQEVSCLLARAGTGISQGIGTGGRDVKEEVGGAMMLAAMQALQADPDTHVLLLVSKPPAASVVEKVLKQASASEKPTVICLLGGELGAGSLSSNVISARTLQEGAHLAAMAAGAALPALEVMYRLEEVRQSPLVASLRKRLTGQQRFLRGLFSGGTLCYEAQLIWKDLLKEPVLSNAPLDPAQKMPDSNRSQGHCAIDLGEEEFTVGRPHPMIDNDLRIRRLQQEARQPDVAVIVLDVVLGYGAHPDPASELAPAIRKARQEASLSGNEPVFIASITGVDGDPQDIHRQRKTLEDAGVMICDSNASAARLSARLLQP